MTSSSCTLAGENSSELKARLSIAKLTVLEEGEAPVVEVTLGDTQKKADKKEAVVRTLANEPR